MGGIVVATSLATCNHSTYDYFMVHRSLKHAVAGVQQLENGGMNPHWASRLLLRGDARRFAIRRLMKPPKVEGQLPAGPMPRPPCYSEVMQHVANPDTLDLAVTSWYSLARHEWSSLVGRSLEHKAPRFRWTSAVGSLAHPQAGATTLSAMWRSLARNAQDRGRLVVEGISALTATKMSVLEGQLTAAPAAIRALCISKRAEAEQPVLAWTLALRSAVWASSQCWIQSLAAVADIKAQKLEMLTARARSAQWRARIGASSPKEGHPACPTQYAYRWVRGLAGWQPSPIGHTSENDSVPSEPTGDSFDDEVTMDSVSHGPDVYDRLIPLADQAAVEKEANTWAQLWKSDDQYCMPSFSAPSEQLGALYPCALRMAASSFPIGTGLGSDNIAPRAMLRLSDVALLALALLLTCFEALGEWTRALDLVLIVLLPKADGGFRPIGLFPTIIRLWMRSRVCIARAWEAANALPSLFGGAGMGAQRAAWEAAFAAELAALRCSDHVQVLLDLVKAFETVPHDKLVEAAMAKGYSIVILRLFLSAYRLQRTVGVGGVFSKLVKATRGITAGSGFATAELRLLLLDVMIHLQVTWAPVLSAKLYVDDLTLSASGLPRTVVRLKSRVLAFVTERLETHLGLEISAKKSVTVAGRPSVARATATFYW